MVHLESIWNILKEVHCVDGTPKGLTEVDFDLDLMEFAQRYWVVSNRVKKTITHVVVNSQEMLNVLEGKDIRAYHLTCGAEQRAKINSALCVHYNEKEERPSVALPGVGYF